eukprot:1582324-Rhodomonas_salina.1
MGGERTKRLDRALALIEHTLPHRVPGITTQRCQRFARRMLRSARRGGAHHFIVGNPSMPSTTAKLRSSTVCTATPKDQRQRKGQLTAVAQTRVHIAESGGW